MRLLVDTHILLWAVAQPDRIAAAAGTSTVYGKYFAHGSLTATLVISATDTGTMSVTW